MRALATAAGAALALALATAPGAAAAKERVTTIGPWTKTAMGEKPMPANPPFTWSYYPNTWGTTCASPPCCGGTGQEPCGPLNWWQQNPKCLPQNGNQQTPINFDINEEGYSGMGKGAGLIFEAGKCAGEVKPKDGVWEVEFFDCSEPFFVTAKGKRYRLWQMHLHGWSEHTVNAGYYPLEAHLVHIPADEELNTATISQALVIGVFLSPGVKSNKIIEIIQHHPAADNEELWKAVNIYDLLPKSKAYWHYTGSLTTPPCQLPTAGFNVQWYVMKTPSMITPAQMTWFTQHFAQLPLTYLSTNTRPIQPIQPGTQIFTFGKTIN